MMNTGDESDQRCEENRRVATGQHDGRKPWQSKMTKKQFASRREEKWPAEKDRVTEIRYAK